MVEPLRKPWASAHAPPTVTGLLRRGPASQALRRPRGAPGTETPQRRQVGRGQRGRSLQGGAGPRRLVGVSPTLPFKVRGTAVLLPGPLLNSTLSYCPLVTATRLAEGSQRS